MSIVKVDLVFCCLRKAMRQLHGGAEPEVIHGLHVPYLNDRSFTPIHVRDLTSAM